MSATKAKPGTDEWRMMALEFSLQYLMVAAHSDKFKYSVDAQKYLKQKGIVTWEQHVEAMGKIIERIGK